MRNSGSWHFSELESLDGITATQMEVGEGRVGLQLAGLAEG